MGRMSDVHQDLESIHQILLGQRKVLATTKVPGFWANRELAARIETIDNMLLEFEAAGIQWPDNVVSFPEV